MMESKTANMKVDSVLSAVLEKLGGKYKHIKHLGGGEFSNVYLVKHLLSNENHALKIMDYHYLIQRLRKEDLADSKNKFNEIKKRFVIEAKMYGKIEHPHIVKILDTGFITNETNDIEIPFIIMNYIKGSSLAEVLKREAPLEVNRALDIAKSLLSVIDVIHRHHIIHRDIKPANIMIEEESGEAILIDFGIAKDIVGGTRLTTTGAFLGSPVYMAPEQFTDSSKVGPEIDIYAFGVVLFEMLTGEPPYKGNSLPEIMSAHREKPVPNIRDVNPALPVGMEDILFKAMAKNPDYRYRNAKEFINDLQNVGLEKRRIPKKPKNRTAYFFYLFILLVITALVLLKPFGRRGDKPKVNIEPAEKGAPLSAPQTGTVINNGTSPINDGTSPGAIPRPAQEEEYNKIIGSVKKYIDMENYSAAEESLKKAQSIEDTEEVRLLADSITGKKAEWERTNGEKEYNGIKEKFTLTNYLEFKNKYPESSYLQDLQDRLKKADVNLPPEKYWQEALQKNQKGYYESIFGVENNEHRMIYIPGKNIWIDKYEVSHRQIKQFFNDEKIKNKGTSKYIHEEEEYPTAVSYEEAEKYCRSRGYRLPTAQEWQYVAGKGMYNYPWGNEAPDSEGIYRANFDSLEGSMEEDGFSGTAPVKSFEKFTSPFGAVNMAGNVWEWVQGRMLKGGGFFSSREDLLIEKSVGGRDNDREGFRCVKDENSDQGL